MRKNVSYFCKGNRFETKLRRYLERGVILGEAYRLNLQQSYVLRDAIWKSSLSPRSTIGSRVPKESYEDKVIVTKHLE